MISRRLTRSSELTRSRDSVVYSSVLNSINSQSRLQAIAFVCKPEYLKTVNFSTQTADLVDVLRSMARIEWFEGQSASWNKIYGAPFALRLTPFGFCFTFNIINATDLMNVDE